MELGCEPEKKKKAQESEDEGGLGWIRGFRGKEQKMSSLALERRESHTGVFNRDFA